MSKTSLHLSPATPALPSMRHQIVGVIPLCSGVLNAGRPSWASFNLSITGDLGVRTGLLRRARARVSAQPVLPRCRSQRRPPFRAVTAEADSGHGLCKKSLLEPADLAAQPEETRITLNSSPGMASSRSECPSIRSRPEFSRFTDASSALVKLAALMAAMLGLFVSSHWALAVPELTQANLNSNFDLGGSTDIQSGFASAFLLIFFSEIGDKTFFIAALLATRKSGVAVFSGTFGALATMTVISVFLGRVFHYLDGILPRFGDTKLPVDDIAACSLLIFFGVSTLLEAASMKDSEAEDEKQEAELAIAGAGAGAAGGTIAATFALVFVAEWGDKSFFSTIALAAASSPIGVVTGAIVGHGAATLLAVLGGSFLGNYISEKIVAYIGGVLFLAFAGVTLFEILN